MTISYTADVANASAFGCFTRILIKWRGSVYKLIYKELLVYMLCYLILNGIYRNYLMADGYETERHFFEGLTAFCRIQQSSIPVTFVLGFYVTLIVGRWWDQYKMLPYPDSLALFVVGLLRGDEERPRLMRRNIMRYFLLSYVITLRRISLRVFKRFPTMEHVVKAGLITEAEAKLIGRPTAGYSGNKWWMPLVWATKIVDKARLETRITNDPGWQTILNEISGIRKGLTGVQFYDTLSVPLVYTQVVTLAVYTYFAAALMGAQWVQPLSAEDYVTITKLPAFSDNGGEDANNATAADGDGRSYQPLDLYAPLFLVLQFVFFVGWLKVAETLINPFGEDDDDFELNYLIDRHIKVSYLIVDGPPCPELVRDMHWHESPADETPLQIPYTKETSHDRKEEPKGSAEVKAEEAENSTYYKLFVSKSNRASQKQMNFKEAASAAAAAGGGGEEPSSEYESIDPSIFGRMKAKIRKSQMRRRASDHAVLQFTASAAERPQLNGGDPVPPHTHNGHRKASATPSLKSQRSIYSKMFGRALPMRRRSSSNALMDAAADAAAGAGSENLPDLGGGGRFKSEGGLIGTAQPQGEYGPPSLIGNNADRLYGRLEFPEGEVTGPSEETYGRTTDDVNDDGGRRGSGSGSSSGSDGSLVNNLMVERLRHLSHLSTITENQNSPYSTNPCSRKNSRPSHPTAEAIFNQVSMLASSSPVMARAAAEAAAAASFYAGSGSEGNAYYALHNESGSGASVNTAVNLADAASASKNPSPALPKRNPIPNSVSIGATSEVTGGGGPASEKSTSRFKVEEVPNYEPILFTTSESGGMKAMLNPKNGEDTTDVPIVPPVVAARRCHESPRDSPALPKRQPVSRLESLDPPKILVTQTSGAQKGGTGGEQVADKSDDPKGGEGYISDDSTNEDDDLDTSMSTRTTEGPSTAPSTPMANASSAFDSATFYV